MCVDSCIFCRIARGEAEAAIVYQDEWVLAIMNLNQYCSGHVLIMPREHYESVLHLPEEVSARLLPVAARMARAVQKALHPLGFNLVSNNGEAAGQEVFHAHGHLVPRYRGDAVRIRWPIDPASLQERQEVAARIRQALEEV